MPSWVHPLELQARKGHARRTLEYELAKMLPISVKYLRNVLEGKVKSANATRLAASRWIIEMYLRKDGKGKEEKDSYEAFLLKLKEAGNESTNREGEKN